MPNWCFNFVTFQGKEASINKLINDLKAHKQENKGFVLPCVDIAKCNSNPYIFELFDEDQNTMQFQTKWSPNIDAILQIAKHYNLNFDHEYEELACQLFGKTIFKDGELYTYNLEQSDFDLYKPSDQNEDNYTYNGSEWDSEAEIIEDIFEKKYPNMLKL